MTKVTGKKITKIIGLGKKKPSTDEQTSSAEEDVPTCGKIFLLEPYVHIATKTLQNSSLEIPLKWL